MKNQDKFLKVENSIFIIFFSLVIISSSCSKNIAFQNSSIVPAARGDVQVKADKNNNYSIIVDLDYLAESSRLSPAKAAYVVWIITDQNLTKNIGQLRSTESGLSKKLKASLKTVTAFKPTKVFITAEDEASTQFPNENIILTTAFFNN